MENLKMGNVGAESAFEEALAQYRSGCFALAERGFRAAVAAESQRAIYHSYLGCALRNLGRLFEAESSYLDALRLEPDRIETRLYLGMVQELQGKLLDARSSYELVLKLLPGHVRAMAHLGAVFCRLDDWDSAISSFRNALETGSFSEEALTYVALALKSQWSRPEALKRLLAFVSSLHSPDLLLSRLAKGLAEQKRLEEAIAILERLATISRAPAPLLLSLAQFNLECGRREACAQALRRYVGIESGNSDAWLHLLEVSLSLDDLETAKTAVRELSDLRSEYSAELDWIYRARKRIAPPVANVSPDALSLEGGDSKASDSERCLSGVGKHAPSIGAQISIVTVCKNAEKFIRRAVASVLAQRYERVEYIIQDGFSTDGTVEALRRLGLDGNLVSAPDAAPLDALLKAARRCTSDFIGVCWADDELEPDAAAWALSQFKETGADVIYGDQWVVNDQTSAVFLGRGSHWSLRHAFRHEAVPIFSSTFFRRESLLALTDRLTLFDHDEYEFWVWLGLMFRVVYVPGVVSIFHRHSGSQWAREGYAARMREGRLRAMRTILSTPEGLSALSGEAEHAETGLWLWMSSHELCYGHIRTALDHFRSALALYNGDYRFRKAVADFLGTVDPEKHSSEHKDLSRLLRLFEARAEMQ
jgi:tetratricopeptide (TPR) repeat protein/glycosyltransferase involved in cell wall biosynthesis